MRLKIIGLLVLIISFFSCEDENQFTEFKNYKVDLVTLIDSLDITPSELSILIKKSEYKLCLLDKSKVLKEYPVVFGKNPIADKLIEGDMKTPEGEFKIRDLYPHKSWSKFLWIDYPTKESYKKYERAKNEGIIPKDSEIGSEIGIHGVPKGKSHLIKEKINWTWGCISLTNKDINEVYSHTFVGMNVKIVK